MAKQPDCCDMEVTPESGTKVEDTKMLTGLGELPAGYNDTNVTTPVEGKPQPKVGK